MELKVIRRPKNECKISTIGQLNVDGAAEAYTLEPPTPGAWPCMKGTGCHPLGKYQVTLSKNKGEVYGWMVKLVPDIAKYGLPLISNIDGITYPDWIVDYDGVSKAGTNAERCVYIHIGNTAKDTLGCLIVGTDKSTDAVSGSTDAFKKIYTQIVAAVIANEDVTIEFVESAL